MAVFYKRWSRHWVDWEGRTWYCTMVNVSRHEVQECWVLEKPTVDESEEPGLRKKDEDAEDKTDEANEDERKMNKRVKWMQDKRVMAKRF